MSLILAIDPGLTGAIAFYDPSLPTQVTVHDMPVVDGEVEPNALIALIRTAKPSLAIIERVGPMPTDSRVSAFRFGASYAAGKVAVAVCGVPYHLVTPAAWKRSLKLGGGAEGKEQSRALALQWFPGSAALFARKKDHGRAEASLLARYCADTFLVRAAA